MEPTTPTAQQAAVQEARARYERGELSYDTFRRALDALMLAQNADECAAILRALPASPLVALTALDKPVPPAPAPPAPLARRKRYVAVMSQTKKVRRRWHLAPRTSAVAVMGEVRLDLNQADLPPQASLRVTAVMGTVLIHVPRGVRVTVRSTALLGDVNALGEHASGVVAFGHEEHVPSPDSATSAPPAASDPPRLDIHVFALMSNVQIRLTDRPLVSVGEVVREMVAFAAEGIHRGLQQRASQQALLDQEQGER